MIGTTGGAALFMVNILLSGALGIGAGGLMCLLLRGPWRLRTAAIDAILAAVAAVVGAFVISAMDNTKGVWESRVSWILAAAVTTVIVRHIIVRIVRPSVTT